MREGVFHSPKHLESFYLLPKDAQARVMDTLMYVLKWRGWMELHHDPYTGYLKDIADEWTKIGLEIESFT